MMSLPRAWKVKSGLQQHAVAASRHFRRAQPLTSSQALFSTAAVVEEEDGSDNNTSQRTTARHDKYPHLFAPLNLGPEIGYLPNRALMGSMHTGLEGHSMSNWMVPMLGVDSSHASHSLDRMATYFQARAAGGVGLMVTGGIAPNRQGWAGPFSAQLTTREEMQRHKVVTEAVHSVEVPIVGGEAAREGGAAAPIPASVPSRICLQILHTGRYAYHPMAVSASSTRSPISPFKAQALTQSGVQQTIRDFVNTAVLAKEAGYDGVEIMGSEGYLLSQFLSPRTNRRTDEYGGDLLENRARMPLEIIRQTRQAVGADFILIFRLSLLDLVDEGLSFDEAVILAEQVQDAGATILNTGIGWHESRVPTIATSVPRASFAFPTLELKKRLGDKLQIPLVATNRINHPQTAETLLSGGHGGGSACDMVSMARPFLADPELILKSRTGREDEINTCIGCNQACLDHVFVGKVASCLVNPAACHETEVQPQLLPTEQRLTIGVVGAGPAGCAFAIAARQMGHNVVLYDASERIGGQFNMAKRIPGKEEFHETIRYLETQLQKHGVDVRLNTTLSVDDMEQDAGVDKWIDATGVEPRNPQIPGQEQAPNVLSYIDVLRHRKPVGQKVAIVGAGGIGFDVAEYLLHSSQEDRMADQVTADDFYKAWGIDTSLSTRGGLADAADTTPQQHRQIYLLQRKKSKLGKGLGKTTGWIHRATLKQSEAVEMIAGAQYKKIDENGHLHVSVNGKEERVLDVDTIVLCAGQVEHDALRQQASPELRDRLFAIGGAYHAGELDAKRAIDMGTRLALRIHQHDLVVGKHGPEAPRPGVEETLFGFLKRFA